MSVLKQYNPATSQWEAVVLGKQGPSGAVAVSAPLTNSGTSTAAQLGIDYSTLQYGQNVVINGAMDFWQRGTSFSAIGYTADRWRLDIGGAGAAATVTQQTFTPGTAPASDREATYYTQIATTPGSDTASYITFEQRIEDVRTFEGKTVTISLWAKAASGTPKLGLEVIQNGVGANVLGIGSQSVTLSTSWARYSFTYNIPALSMTFAQAGAPNLSLLSLNFWLSGGSTLNTRSGSVGLQAATFHLWGVQAEVGSTATPFKRHAPSIEGELAACQRYAVLLSGTSTSTFAMIPAFGFSSSSSRVELTIIPPVPLRVIPTSISYSGMGVQNFNGSGIVSSPSLIAIDAGASGNVAVAIVFDKSGAFSTGNTFRMLKYGANDYILLSAEL